MIGLRGLTRVAATAGMLLHWGAAFAAAGPGVSPAASEHSAGVAIAWMELALDLVREERLSPPVASRLYAYAGIAAYEAALPGMPGHRSLSGQLNGLESLPEFSRPQSLAGQSGKRLAATLVPALAVHARRPASGVFGLDWPSVVSVAVSELLLDTVSGLPEDSATVIRALRLEQLIGRAQSGVRIADLRDSILHGAAVAEALSDWAAADGFLATRGLPHEVPTGPGLWEPTGPVTDPLEPYWGTLRPFALQSGDACRPPVPAPYSELVGSEFHAQAYATYAAVQGLTAEQYEIALFWADNPGQTSTPPGHWVAIVGQFVMPLSLEEAVEAYALVGIALADAFISCWDEKYRSNVLRPITYIQRFIDPGWVTAIPTPPFPEYSSGHSVASGAAATVLTQLFGEVAFTDSTHLEALGLAPRHFQNFQEAAQEAAVSRLYGGIHYPMAIEDGLVQGECVAATVLVRVQTRR